MQTHLGAKLPSFRLPTFTYTPKAPTISPTTNITYNMKLDTSSDLSKVNVGSILKQTTPGLDPHQNLANNMKTFENVKGADGAQRSYAKQIWDLMVKYPKLTLAGLSALAIGGFIVVRLAQGKSIDQIFDELKQFAKDAAAAAGKLAADLVGAALDGVLGPDGPGGPLAEGIWEVIVIFIYNLTKNSTGFTQDQTEMALKVIIGLVAALWVRAWVKKLMPH